MELAASDPAPAPALPVAGWYPDPETPDQHRWWDGSAWSRHVVPEKGAPRTADSIPTTGPPRCPGTAIAVTSLHASADAASRVAGSATTGTSNTARPGTEGLMSPVTACDWSTAIASYRSTVIDSYRVHPSNPHGRGIARHREPVHFSTGGDTEPARSPTGGDTEPVHSSTGGTDEPSCSSTGGGSEPGGAAPGLFATLSRRAVRLIR